MIFDCRSQSKVNISFIELYDFITSGTKQFRTKGIHPKHAYVFPESTRNKLLEYGANVAMNKGSRLGVFYDFDEAVKWLNLEK